MPGPERLRGQSQLVLLAALVLAGCATPTPANQTHGGMDDIVPALPESVQFRGDMPPSVEVLPNGRPNCQLPSAACIAFDLALARDVAYDLRLTWGLPTNDLDVYLMQGDEVVTRGAPLSVGQALKLAGGDLKAGSYQVVVLGTTTGPERFTVEFLVRSTQ